MFTYEYLPWRGVSAESFKKYGVQTKVDAEGKPISLGYKYPNGDVKVRTLDKKDFFWVKNGSPDKAGLFGRDKFAAGGKSITITEGELDAVSLYQVLGGTLPVVSVQSSSTAVRDCTADWDYLNQFDRIYLAFDGDTAGRDALAAVARLFDYDKVVVLAFAGLALKDSNEFLLADKASELRNLWWTAKRRLPESIKSSFADFEAILSKPKKVGVPYPFPTVTEMTYGIRTGECVLLKAFEKVGKTELVRAIEYQLLEKTNDNIGAIFLEETPERNLQGLAGIHLRQPVHLPDCSVTQAEVLRAVRDLVRVDDRLHVHTRFGSDDPTVLLDDIRFLVAARGCRYILLDHIHMAVSGRGEADERLKLDWFSSRIETMVKDLDFGLIMVSHVNDLGQTRGSRYLTKIADITIDAARNTLDPIEANRNTVRLSIPFNRFCGRSGPAGSYMFDQNTQRYTEVADNDTATRATALNNLPNLNAKAA